jgi:hypothetical protein
MNKPHSWIRAHFKEKHIGPIYYALCSHPDDNAQSSITLDRLVGELSLAGQSRMGAFGAQPVRAIQFPRPPKETES